MTEPTIVVTTAIAGLAGLGIASLAALHGWRGWLDLKRLELSGRGERVDYAPSPTSRIELADLKERVRKLEGIAAGVDL